MKLLPLLLLFVSPLAWAASSLPNINIREVIWQIIVVLVVLGVLAILDYIIQSAPIIGAGAKPILRWILIVIGCLYVIYMVLGWVGL